MQIQRQVREINDIQNRGDDMAYGRYMVFYEDEYDNPGPFDCLEGAFDCLELARTSLYKIKIEEEPFDAFIFDRVEGVIVK